MNALYLILIALGFAAGVTMSTLHSNNITEANCIEPIEMEVEENVIYEAEVEVQPLSLIIK